MYHEPDHYHHTEDDQYYEDKNNQRHNGIRGTVNGLLFVIGLCTLAYVIYQCIIHF